jgi:hypothetical protein
MIDLQAKLEQFETLIAECELIAKLATDEAKRELLNAGAVNAGEIMHRLAGEKMHQ